jgi:hypothetical protein
LENNRVLGSNVLAERPCILACNTIERVNGNIKSRFRCLLRHRVLHYHTVKAAKIICACAVLHNICKHFYNELPHEDPIDDDEDDLLDPANNNWLNDGRRIRQGVIQNLFNNN